MTFAVLHGANNQYRWCSPAVRCLVVAFLCAFPSFARPSTNHLQSAIEFISQGNFEGAEKEARTALQSPADRAPAWGILGTIRVQQKKYDEGAEFLLKAINLNPRLVGARVTLGGVYLLQGKNNQASEMFRAALRLDPTNVNARLDLAQLESAQGHFRDSMEVAKPIAAGLEHSPDGLLLLATNYSGLQQKERLQALAPAWNDLQNSPPELTASFASLLIKNGFRRQGIELLEKAHGDGPHSFDVAFALAGAYASTGDSAHATEGYEAALSLKGDCVPCLTEIARIAEHDGNTEKALAYLIRAKRISPENPEVLFAFGRVCLQRDLNDDAIAALTKAAALRPGNDSYAYVLATAHVARKEYKAARALLEGLVKKHPEDPALHYGLGSVLYLDQDFDPAEQHLKKTLALQPDQRAAFYYLGLIAEGKNERDRALKILGDLAQRYPDYAAAYEAVGSILLKERNFVEAQKMLEKAVQLNAKSVKAHYQLGMLLGRIGKQDESTAQLEIARKLESEERARNEMQLHILMPE